MNPVKKIVAYILIGLVLLFTVIAVLGIWEIIDIREVMLKVLYSLLVLFAASAVILFIFTVVMKDDSVKNE